MSFHAALLPDYNYHVLPSFVETSKRLEAWEQGSVVPTLGLICTCTKGLYICDVCVYLVMPIPLYDSVYT